MNKDYTFFLNDKIFQIPKSLKFLNRLSESVCNKLLFENEYTVISKVHLEHFSSFLDYLNSEKESPIINSDNLYDYRLLGEEISNNASIFTDPKFDDLYPISILKNVTKSDSNSDISEKERYISQNLDLFLEKYSTEMYNIPFTSLYNIFYHQDRKLTKHDLAYEFIIKSSNEKQPLFILLGSLDSKQLKTSLLIDSLLKHENHMGFLPLLDFSFIDELNKIFSELEIDTNRVITEAMKELFIKFNQINEERQQKSALSSELMEEINFLNQKFQEEIHNKKANISKLQNKNNQLKQKKQKLKEEIQDKDNNISKLQNENNQLNQNNQNLQNEIQNNIKAINEIKSSFDPLQQAFQKLQDEIQIKDDIINSFQNILDPLRQLSQVLNQIPKFALSSDILRKIDDLNQSYKKINIEVQDKAEKINNSPEKRKSKRRKDLSKKLVSENSQMSSVKSDDTINLSETETKLSSSSEDLHVNSMKNQNSDNESIQSSDNSSTFSNSDLLQLNEEFTETQMFGSQFTIENIENLKITPNIKDDKLIIMQFMRTFLYNFKNDMSVRKFYIENKSDSTSTVGDLLKIIKKDYSSMNPNQLIKYYLYKEGNYKIKFLNDNSSISDIPSHFFFQIKPHKGLPFRICVFIDIQKININEFDANKDGIPFAIPYFKENNVKESIMNYLLYSVPDENELKQSIPYQPVLYKFDHNSFTPIFDYDEFFNNPEIPCFVSLRSPSANEFIFDLFRSHISNKLILRPI